MADHIAQLAAGGGLILEGGKGNAGLLQESKQSLGHIRHGIAGGIAQPYEGFAFLGDAFVIDLGFLGAVGVAGFHQLVDDLLGEVGGQLLEHGMGAGFADEDEGIKTGHAVGGAGAAEQALVHGNGRALIHLHAALHHADLQTLGAGGVVFLTGHQLDGAQVTAHIAETAASACFLAFSLYICVSSFTYRPSL